MAGFLGAHGYDPGPTQRPLLAGAIVGLLATVPAIAPAPRLRRRSRSRRGSSACRRCVTLGAGWRGDGDRRGGLCAAVRPRRQ